MNILLRTRSVSEKSKIGLQKLSLQKKTFVCNSVLLFAFPHMVDEKVVYGTKVCFAHNFASKQKQTLLGTIKSNFV